MKHLLIFLNNSSYFLIPLIEKTAEQAYSDFLKAEESLESDVRVKFELDESELPNGLYYGCLDVDENNKLIYHSSDILYLHFSAYWLPTRKHLLESLDIEYSRASESDDKLKKDFIVKRKNYLRDFTDFLFKRALEFIGVEKFSVFFGEGELPAKIFSAILNLEKEKLINFKKLFRESISKEEAFQITPFYNILEVKVVDGGFGYETPPEIKLECKKGFQFAPILEVELENSSIKSVKVVSPGCGYIFHPIIKITSPTGENGRAATLSVKVENKMHEL